MKLHCELNMELQLIHKLTAKEIILEQNIGKDFDEDSEEYKFLCEECEEQIGNKREQNKDEFDKKLLKIVLKSMKDTALNNIDRINKVVKKSFMDNAGGYISFGGAIINLSDFCVVKIKKFDTNCKKC